MKHFKFVVLGCVIALASVAVGQVVPAAYRGILVDKVGVKTYPGSAWTDLGNVSPEEHGNIISSSYVEQGVTLFKWGALSFTPYVSAAVGADTKGYDWNNRLVAQGGLRLDRTFKDGIVSIGSGYGVETRWISDPSLNGGMKFMDTRRATIDYAQWWFGWHKGHDGMFSGSHWGTLGNLSPVEKNNLIGMGHVEQDVIVKRFGKAFLAPYGELTMSGDITGYDWENKAVYGGGIKVASPVKNTNTLAELLAGYSRESRFISGAGTGQLTIQMRFWIGWSPARKAAL